MQAGQLNRRITIEQSTETRGSDYKDVQRSWATFATVWAHIEPLTGRELLQQMEVRSEVTTRIVIRYLPGVLPKWRVVYGSRILQIDAVMDVDTQHRETHLLCSEFRREAS